MRAHSQTATFVGVLAAVLAAGIIGQLPVHGRQDPTQQKPTEQPAGQQPASQPPATQPPADQTPDRAQQPIRTGINFVRVDVIVTDNKGEPVLDLKPEEFTITEDGKPQRVEQFSMVKIDAVGQGENRPTTAIRSDFDEEREA